MTLETLSRACLAPRKLKLRAVVKLSSGAAVVLLSPEAACALEAALETAQSSPSAHDFVELFARGTATYYPGVRASSFPSSHTATREAAAVKPPKADFTFAEIFAGIGGFRIGPLHKNTRYPAHT